MWLDEKRARIYRMPDEFTAVLAAKYPDGTKLTRTKLLALDKLAASGGEPASSRSRTSTSSDVTSSDTTVTTTATRTRTQTRTTPVRPIDWSLVAAATLTTDGRTSFTDKLRQHAVDNATSIEIALDKQRARFYRARAAWREKHNVNPHVTPTGDALTELRELERLNQPSDADVVATRKFQLETFVELMSEQLRPELVDKPRVRALKPGEVLVTWRTLERLGSCGTYINRFRDRWPEGTVITKQLCVDNSDDFEWGWAASQLLNRNGHRDWENAYYREEEELRRRSRELREAYETLRTDLRNQRDRGELTAAQLTTKLAAAKEDHDRIMNVVNTELRTVAARMFADLYATRPRPDLADYAE